MNNSTPLKFNNQDWQVNLRDDVDGSVFNEIFKIKEYRRAEEVIVNARYPIVDVGAHAGFFTMYCRALNEKAKIFAIEPEPNNLETLKKHLKINKISGVKAVAGALARESGVRQLTIAEDSHNHALAELEFYNNPTDKNDSSLLKIKALSFADFCKQNKIKKISLIKFDIEGGEYEVFEDISEKDLAVVNYVVLEYHNGREKSRDIEEKLRMNGFAVQIFPSKFDKTMGFIFGHNKRFV
jgi:FkbM family methyltransferase